MRRYGNVILAVIFFLPVPISAADDVGPKWAATDLEQVDDDFAFQGEYLGSSYMPSTYCCRSLGLQVVSHGNGKFIATGYWGGLPGYGWYGGDRLSLEGVREGETLQLTGEELAVTIQRNRGTVYPASSSRSSCLGYLQPVRRQSHTLGARPPCGATVLFDGRSAEHFKGGRMTEDGLLEVGTQLERAYGDYYLHLEFRLPYMPYARGQGRSNSGVYLQSRYEVQILDSFGLEGKNNECGGLYQYREPEFNMCLPPLAWQTYDIWFTSPRFNSADEKVRNARLTVWHNGVAIHDDFEIERKTGAGAKESPELLPTKLQNHGNPVRFRNIWIVDYGNPEVYQPRALVQRCR